MNLAGIIPAEVIKAIGWTLLHSLWQGFIILLGAYLLVWIFRHQSSRIRYHILCISLAFILLSSVTTFILVMPSGSAEVKSAAFIPVIMAQDAPKDINGTNALNSQPFIGSILARADSFLEKNKSLLVLSWFLGCMFFITRYIGGLIYISRLRKRGTRGVEVKWIQKLNMLRISAGIRRPVQMLESVYIRVPVTIGHLKPLILFPAGMLGSLPPEQTEAILLHEMAHILRRDYLVNTLQTLMEAIFFYHPAVWLISNGIREERENSCDDIAVRQSNDPLTYIKALTTMEELKSTSPVMATAFTGHKKKLLSRVRRMVEPSGRKIRPAESLLSTLALVILVILLGAGASFNTSRAETASANGFPAINPDAVYSMSYQGSLATVNSPEASAKVELQSNSVPGEASETIAVEEYMLQQALTPDTTKKTAEEMAAAEKEKAAQEEALKNLEFAIQERQAAMKAYEKALQEYQGVLKEMQPELENYGFTWYSFGDSLDSAIALTIPEIPGAYYLYDGNFDFPILEIPDPETFDPAVRDYYYYFENPDVPASPGDTDMEIIIEQYNDQLKQLEKEYQWMEKDMKDQQKELERSIIVSPPDVRVQTLPPTDPERLARLNSPERIIRQELAMDGLITRGRDYIVEINSSSMYINGVKQSREVFKKYKKLYEGLIDDTIQGDQSYKMIF